MSTTIDDIHGRVVDLDSHERVPVPRWGEVWGQRGQRFSETSVNLNRNRQQKNVDPDNPGMYLLFDSPDTLEITPETVWTKKGTVAPSASDMSRRPAVLDAMGIDRALIFGGITGHALGDVAPGVHVTTEEQKQAAWDAIEAFNEWAGELTSKFPVRLRIVGVLKPQPTVELLVSETERLLRFGIRAIRINEAVPPAGLSPADPRLDPWYGLIAAENAALVTHTGPGSGFVPEAWVSVDFGDVRRPTHLATEFVIRLMTLGGVFERNPRLRFGAIEIGSYWLGPLVDSMDLAVDGDLPEGMGAKKLPMKPSEYVNRNVRVTPLNFEPLVTWFEKYPQIQDCYCYSSDYPHVEGREWSLHKNFENIKSLGDEIIEKYFVTNGQLLVP